MRTGDSHERERVRLGPEQLGVTKVRAGIGLAKVCHAIDGDHGALTCAMKAWISGSSHQRSRSRFTPQSWWCRLALLDGASYQRDDCRRNLRYDRQRRIAVGW